MVAESSPGEVFANTSLGSDSQATAVDVHQHVPVEVGLAPASWAELVEIALLEIQLQHVELCEEAALATNSRQRRFRPRKLRLLTQLIHRESSLATANNSTGSVYRLDDAIEIRNSDPLLGLHRYRDEDVLAVLLDEAPSVPSPRELLLGVVNAGAPSRGAFRQRLFQDAHTPSGTAAERLYSLALQVGRLSYPTRFTEQDVRPASIVNKTKRIESRAATEKEWRPIPTIEWELRAPKRYESPTTGETWDTIDINIRRWPDVRVQNALSRCLQPLRRLPTKPTEREKLFRSAVQNLTELLSRNEHRWRLGDPDLTRPFPIGPLTVDPSKRQAVLDSEHFFKLDLKQMILLWLLARTEHQVNTTVAIAYLWDTEPRKAHRLLSKIKSKLQKKLAGLLGREKVRLKIEDERLARRFPDKAFLSIEFLPKP